MSAGASKAGSDRKGSLNDSKSLQRSTPPGKVSSKVPPKKENSVSKCESKSIQTSVSVEVTMQVEFITLDEIRAIQKDRDDLEGMVHSSIASALKMKEKVRKLKLLMFLFQLQLKCTVRCSY
jgi:hypothetical protein